MFVCSCVGYICMYAVRPKTQTNFSTAWVLCVCLNQDTSQLYACISCCLSVSVRFSFSLRLSFNWCHFVSVTLCVHLVIFLSNLHCIACRSCYSWSSFWMKFRKQPYNQTRLRYVLGELSRRFAFRCAVSFLFILYHRRHYRRIALLLLLLWFRFREEWFDVKQKDPNLSLTFCTLCGRFGVRYGWCGYCSRPFFSRWFECQFSLGCVTTFDVHAFVQRSLSPFNPSLFNGTLSLVLT